MGAGIKTRTAEKKGGGKMTQEQGHPHKKPRAQVGHLREPYLPVCRFFGGGKR